MNIERKERRGPPPASPTEGDKWQMTEDGRRMTADNARKNEKGKNGGQRSARGSDPT
jgi:hypothetical protein